MRKLIVLGRSVHLIEIQRRSATLSDDDEKPARKGEAFYGVAVSFDNEGNLGEWL